MSDDLEENLRAMRLAAPSVDLDRRMAALFASAPRAGRGWWLAALATAGVAAAALVLLSPPPPVPAPARPVGYQVEAPSPLREWLLTPPPESQPPPTMIVTVGR